MSDRSLLEDAAKAAGIYTIGGWSAFGMFAGLHAREDDAPGGYCWNPLQDDAQALRLAIQLKIVWSFQCKFVVIEDGTSTIGEALGYDSAAAVRRAIVRKAAWITRAAAAISSQNRGVV